ncbi:MAG: hypothetical protein KGH60_05200 [Candidatus Micrarchaeota archaeon]|nr:hypothetical protein [Candidatus Micrarchaeota archaeon]
MSDYYKAGASGHGQDPGPRGGNETLGLIYLTAFLILLSVGIWLASEMGFFGGLLISSLICAICSAIMWRFGWMPQRAVYCFAILAILLIGIMLRSTLIQYQGLFEPDGFYYYSVINQTIHNNLTVPGYSALSGFPWHNPRGDEPGLPFLTVLFYLILKPIGATALQVMRNLPVLFGLIYMVLAYFLAKGLSNSRTLGIISMAFVGISSGNIARTAATVYRGDTFISLFILVALLFLFKAFKSETGSIGRYLAIALASITLSLSIMVWSGSPFIIAVYMFALLMFAIYGFVAADHRFLKTALASVVGLLGTYLLENLFAAINAARAPIILFNQGSQFMIFFIPLLIGVVLAYLYIGKKRSKSMTLHSWQLRLLGSILFIAIAAGIIYAVFGSELSNINAAVTSAYNPHQTVASAVIQAITQTTQETQLPSLDFLLNSFSLQLLFAPVGIILFVLFAQRHHRRAHDDTPTIRHALIGGTGIAIAFGILAAVFATGASAAMFGTHLASFTAPLTYAAYAIGIIVGALCYWLATAVAKNPTARFLLYGIVAAAFTIVLLLFGLYNALYMLVATAILDIFAIYGAIGSQIKINASAPFLALLSYFVITAYLQSTAIRYNALLSIPLSIFAAYGVYMAGKLLWERRLSPEYKMTVVFSVLIAGYVAGLFVAGTLPQSLPIFGLLFVPLTYLYCVIGAILGAFFYWAVTRLKSDSAKTQAGIVVAALLAILTLIILVFTSQPLGNFITLPLITLAFCIFTVTGARKNGVSQTAIAATVINIAIILLAVSQFGSLYMSSNALLLVSAVLIDIIVVGLYVYNTRNAATEKPMSIWVIFAALVSIFVIVNTYNTYIGVATAGQADGINTQFLSAMSWLNNNTPANATVWGIWPDGSVIEGFGNRQSYMDSVGGENGTRIFYASQFLFNTTTDSQYLLNNYRPQYIVARTFWMAELGGLAQEGLVQNMTLYGYDIMNHVTQATNGTTRTYAFSSSNYNVELVINRNDNGSASFVSFINPVGSNRYAPLKNILFYNLDLNNYSIVTDNNTGTANYTLMVTYGNAGLKGGALLGPKLVASNLFKLIYLCNSQSCAFGDKNVSLTPVLWNNDSRIYKVNYNSPG